MERSAVTHTSCLSPWGNMVLTLPGLWRFQNKPEIRLLSFKNCSILTFKHCPPPPEKREARSKTDNFYNLWNAQGCGEGGSSRQREGGGADSGAHVRQAHLLTLLSNTYEGLCVHLLGRPVAPSKAANSFNVCVFPPKRMLKPYTCRWGLWEAVRAGEVMTMEPP